MMTMMKCAEVAALLKVSVTTVKRLIESGSLKASKVGARWRVSLTAVNEMLERKTK